MQTEYNTRQYRRMREKKGTSRKYWAVPDNTGEYRKVQGSIGEYEYLKMQMQIFVNVVMVLGIPEKLSKHTENIGMH